MDVTLMPVGTIGRPLLEAVKARLESLGFSCFLSKEHSIPDKAYNPLRNQYLVHQFLDLVNTEEGHHLLITSVDLYIKGLNFIFGYAPGPNAIISIARLQGARLEERTVKEAVHELGHVLSLGHCSNPRCVMHFSNTLSDTDYKSVKFCSECLKRLPPSFQE
ncbi:MAG: archaemetzincin family Zn-dependent metalloprotease [Theionarchaea archaeon]|nr:archaemetzincin family Zn-dependent metalloprotease [Theionarchaea archaeon]MBU7040826.1 archaemetzincin family Zn-dependent metalloprotease [Theionarchaea archaeon]